uniref:Uncharacterized protein n=1 Tax=Nelumbo nucifera TaxID=4432 RepID=A0A822YTW1_NELNU|nr:TPA_asm: hypothetical protein HUJ06_005479 [Nelumbo nucifera]
MQLAVTALDEWMHCNIVGLKQLILLEFFSYICICNVLDRKRKNPEVIAPSEQE